MYIARNVIFTNDMLFQSRPYKRSFAITVLKEAAPIGAGMMTRPRVAISF